VGVGIDTQREVRRPLDANGLASLTVVRGSDYSYDGDPDTFLLGVEAERIRIAYQFDPLFAVNSSAVDVLPHQVEAVYRYLLPLPGIRFLLADDTGAGKTIMTGLLNKELLFRDAVGKVNNDGQCTPLDVLLVINHLNATLGRRTRLRGQTVYGRPRRQPGSAGHGFDPVGPDAGRRPGMGPVIAVD
jgi:hypothetical protein